MAIERPRFFVKTSAQGQGDPSVISALALQVFLSPKIQLSRSHVSRVSDHATARQNTIYQLFGRLAHRSKYENAPGGEVTLDVRMLRGLIELSKYYTFTVSELTGGSHSRKSTHYRGIAFDANVINGRRVDKEHPDYKRFMDDCRQLGATEVLGPPRKGHETHVHAGWSSH